MKVILLDVGNVVLNVDFSVFCNSLSGGDAEKGSRLYNKYCKGQLKEAFDSGNLSSSEFFRMAALEANDSAIDVDEVKRYWVKIFSEIEGSNNAIEQLKENFSIWIVSDTDPIHSNFFLNEYPILKQVERCYFSYSIGKLKSDPGFFDYVLQSSGREPSDFFLIDDKAVNCQSATSKGIDFDLFTDWKTTLINLSIG
ncbi:MAG: haloacid dehalogenase [Gammaproteobacteria bacterium]